MKEERERRKKKGTDLQNSDSSPASIARVSNNLESSRNILAIDRLGKHPFRPSHCPMNLVVLWNRLKLSTTIKFPSHMAEFERRKSYLDHRFRIDQTFERASNWVLASKESS